MAYQNHKDGDCDRCGKRVGKANLKKLPFAYLDCNDSHHEDISWQLGYPPGTGYRQYWVCSQCYSQQVAKKQ